MTMRMIPIALVGSMLIYLAWLSKHRTIFFNEAAFAIGALLGCLLLIRTARKDLRTFRAKGGVFSFATTIAATLLALMIIGMKWRIHNDFNKPSLLQVFYDGDYNGTSIDFKKDGTYIFDNAAIGLSSFLYGTYTIRGNRIVLDKNNLDGVVVSRVLEVVNRPGDAAPDKKEKFLLQVWESGHIIEDATTFRVVADNR